MITVADARGTARTRLTRHLTAWAVEPPAPPTLSISLKPPTERDAMADPAAAEAWARAWAAAALPHGAVLEQETRVWRRIGRQVVPVRLRLGSPDAVADLAGGSVRQDWHRLCARVGILRDRLGPSPALDGAIRRHASDLLDWSDGRFDRVVDVVGWLASHPAAGLRPRQVPIRGVDTKWLASHRAAVTSLHAAVTGDDTLGLVDADRLVRVRFLDPTTAPGGIGELAAPSSELADLDVEARVVLVLENLESLLALPSWSGVAAVHGSGYFVDVVASWPWVRRARVVYWGDLDSHGFAILHRLRTHLPTVTTVLMDEGTLVAHRDLWVVEPRPSRAELPSLEPAERRALKRLRIEGDVRLEQERVPWATAIAALRQAIDG